MGKLRLAIIVIAIMFYGNINLYAQSGIFESFAIIDSGFGNNYYDLNPHTQTPNFDFNGTNLGTFQSTDTFILNGGQNNIFKCGSDDVTSGWLHYRIYPSGSPSGTFLSIDLSSNVQNFPGAACGGTGDNQSWSTTNANINVLSGLTSGVDYTIEVYTTADFSVGGTPNPFPHTVNNGGANFSATFRVDNPPTASCTNYTAQLDNSGNASITATNVDGGSSDDFGITSMTVSPNTFNCSNIGSNTVTLTVTDTNGQTDTCTATVTVEDNIDPTTPTLADVTGECLATATAPTTTDNCSGTLTGTTTDPLTYSTQGTYVINWTFDDGNGNTIVVPQTVIVDDVTDPTTPTLADVTGECSATATAPTTTDNCSGTLTGTTTDPLTYSTQGTYVINWTFDDGNGNTIVVPQTVIVDDVTDPTTPTLADVTGECSATATAPTTTDNCSGTLTGTTTDPLTYSTQGTYVINWTFDDGNGNTIVVPQTVIVDDVTDPTTPTLADVTGECSATATAPTTTDNCSGTLTGTTTDPLTYNTQGTYVINWTFDDGNGNTIVVPQNVIVDDVTDPTTPTLADVTGECSATATAPTTTDNCSGTLTGTTTDPLTYSTQGTYVINWTFDDGNGNTIVVPQTVIVDDVTDPTTPTLADVTGECSATATAPTTTDNCSGTLTGTTTDPLTYNTQGTYVINWTFDDGNGNTIVVPQTVIVDDVTDPTTPTLADVTGECSATATAPTTTDNCSGTLTGTTTDPLTYSTQGTYVINWTFDDGNGNTIVVPQNVIVDDVTDPTTPTLADVTGECSATATAPTTTDNCSGTLTGTTTDPLTYSTQGIYVINWTFDDGNGNSITVPQNVIVDDVTDPTTPTLADVTGECSATATAPTTTDNCSGTLTGTTTDPLTYNTQGTYVINWTFDDGNGNTIVVPQNVIVDDVTDPATPTLADVTGECSATATAPTTTDNCSGTLTGTTTDPLTYSTQGTFVINWTFDDGNGNTIVVPQNVIVDDVTDPTTPTLADVTGECSATATAPTTTDNCSGTLTGTTTDPLTYSTQGTFVINWTFDDGNGNTIVVPQNVIVDDVTDPATPTLADVTGECSATATAPTTSDNCSGTLTGTTTDPLTYSTQGTYVINWTFDDGNGNSITVPQNLIVDDVTDPTTPTLADVTGECSATATAPTTTDNCSGTLTGTTTDPLTYSTQGTFVINWTFDDGNGNSIIVPQNVIVDDVTDPATPTLADVTGECSATATAPTTTDNCSGTLMGTTTDPLTYSTQGTFVINWTFDDGNGNTIVVPQNVIVDDVTDPTTPTLADVTGECSATATAPTTTDNCSGTLTGTTTDPLTYNTQGTYVINWTFDDGNGNSIIVPQNVIVDDVTDPVTPNLPIITGQCSATVPIPSTTDGCTGTITGTTSDPLTYNTQGSYAVNWTFDDGNGNVTNVVQNVVVDDTIDPIAVCQDLTIQLDDTTGTATIIGSQLDNGSSDNCGLVNFSLSQSIFDCTDIGTNIVVLTVDDGNGNTDTCTATVTVTSPNIDGGTALGYLNNTETAADSDNIIEVTACPDEPQNATINLSGHSGSVAFWQTSTNGGVIWSDVANTTTSFYYANILETTLVRAVVQIGSCQATSSIVVVAVVPPDVPPTIIGPSEYTICLGEAITVEAESSFSVNTELNNGGQFNQANLPGWLVDGADGVSGWNASGSNTSPTPWRGISNGNGNNSSNITEGVRYKNQGGGKFAITYGDFNGADPSPPVTTLETAVFNTLGLTNASIDFQSAYYLQSGASGIVELSVDGGATYPVTLMSFNGPGDSGGFVNQGNGGNNVPTVNLQDGIHSVSLDLSDYVGLTDLRVRFIFTSTVGSSWAIDGITLPQAPVDEVIEWEDGTGTVVTTGSSTTITPVTPGIQTYGVTSLINGCRADGPEGTEFIDVNATLAYAGEDIAQIIGECGEDVELNAYDNNLTAAQNIANGVSNAAVFTTGTYPGTAAAGVWSANLISSCGGNYSFSDLGSPSSKFSADPGTYEVTWTIPSINCSDTMIVTIESCPTIDFDGTNDYITFKDNYDLSNEFSIEVWVKPESVTGTQTLFSKRDANDLTSGYDLRLTGATVQFNWNSTETIQSSYPISIDRWYHIAVTNDSGNYRLYIDGIEVSSPVAGIAPTTNAMASIVGAMDQNNNPPNKPVNYYNGWMDELRIWSTALTQDQIRQMMNQEIDDNTLVRGAVVPLDITGLPWADLEGYYRMDVLCGKLVAYKGLTGLLRNMDSAQQETAPIPYTSRVDGQEWATDNTWTNFNVWDAPNSIGVDNTTPIDWNIVETSHDIFSGDKDITVLGLISDTANKELEIRDPSTPNNQTNDGQMLRVTHYLELDGNIKLVGQSQLLQDFGSVLATTSAGSLERHQQGTLNENNYNYLSAPVGTLNTSSNNVAYTVPSVLRDGTNANNISTITFNDGAIDPSGTAGNLTMAGYWLWYYNNRNDVEDEQTNYDAWQYLGSSTPIDVGLGYTMKGSGLVSAFGEQNWAFVGKPNNGDNINFNINADHQTLLGNPYPSALDSHKFIDDNIPGSGTGAIDGTLYFWEHYPENQTHFLEEYEGGYATLTKLGSVPAAVISSLISGNTTANPKRPGRYIPVAQGFFVQAPEFGSGVRTINFNNSQRIFYREGVDLETPSGDDSVFLRNNSDTVSASSSQNDNEQIIRSIRFFFNSQGYSRELLLGFTSDNDATDGVDFGYDAGRYDVMLDDISWKIEDRDFVIQGVGEYDSSKIYPLYITVANDGEIVLEANEIENFENDIDVFLYDSVLNSYTSIKNVEHTFNLSPGEYVDRFYIVFESQALNIEENDTKSLGLYYLENTNEIYVNWINTNDIVQIELFNILGQSVKLWDDISSESNTELRIPVIEVPHGAYVVKLKLKSGSIVSRKVIIKQ